MSALARWAVQARELVAADRHQVEVVVVPGRVDGHDPGDAGVGHLEAHLGIVPPRGPLEDAHPAVQPGHGDMHRAVGRALDDRRA